MVPLERPLLVYDEDDRVCRLVVARVRANTDQRIDVLSIADGIPVFPDVSRDELRRGFHLFLPEGGVVRGARAIFEAMARGSGSPAWLVALRLHRALDGPESRPATHHLARFFTLRLLAVVSLAAFLSIRGQLDGLFGVRGIAPVVPLIAQVKAIGVEQGWSGWGTFRRFPTLMLYQPTDGAMRALCSMGVIASLLLLFDVLPGFALAIVWLSYLSLVTAGSAFFHFQWDALLLETSVTALFLAPFLRLRPRLREERDPSRLGLWMMRLLVFKLMFLSGAVKLLSKDPIWSSLRALEFHYWTQPLPVWTSFYAHHLPRAIGKISVLVTLVIELVIPFLIFAPRRARRFAFWAFLFLQIMIALTGNYGFFNLLTVVTSVVLLDDGAFPRWLSERVAFRPAKPEESRGPVAPVAPVARARVIALRFGRIARAGVAAVILVVSAIALVSPFMKDPENDLPETLRDLNAYLAPFDSDNGYGLFRSMTTKRPEIIVEGSNDGLEWRAYQFPYKPGDLRARPRFAFLDMPRLDWEMWFAALRGHCTRAPWYLEFVRRLLEGSPPVLGLLAGDPFLGKPPIYIRSTLWSYEPTTLEEHAQSGAYWKATRLGVYCPTLALQEGELIPVEP